MFATSAIWSFPTDFWSSTESDTPRRT